MDTFANLNRCRHSDHKLLFIIESHQPTLVGQEAKQQPTFQMPTVKTFTSDRVLSL